MDTFYLIVITIAVVIFIISIMWIYNEIKESPNIQSSVFPPKFSAAPDYWTIDNATNTAIIPQFRNKPKYTLSNDIIHKHNETIIYTPGYIEPTTTNTSGRIDFSNSLWNTYSTNTSNDCAWRLWAKRAGVSWDGITNYNQC